MCSCLCEPKPTSSPASRNRFNVSCTLSNLPLLASMSVVLPKCCADRFRVHLEDAIQFGLGVLRLGVEGGDPLHLPALGIVAAKDVFELRAAHLAGVDSHLLAAAKQFDAVKGIIRGEILLHLPVEFAREMGSPLDRIVPGQHPRNVVFPPADRGQQGLLRRLRGQRHGGPGGEHGRSQCTQRLGMELPSVDCGHRSKFLCRCGPR